MTTNYPAAIDTPQDVSPTEFLNDPVDSTYGDGHAGEHNFANDAIVAIQTKLGINASTNKNTVDYKLQAIEVNGQAASIKGVQEQLYSYETDTGAANAYVIAPSPAITAYLAGMQFSFKAANANTGISTVAVSGLATKVIKKIDGATDLQVGDILVGQIVFVEYDGTNFQIISPPGSLSLFASKAGVQAQLYTYAADTGSANAYAIALSPSLSAYATGQSFTFKAANSNTTASTLNVNGLGTKAIVKGLSTALAANDIVAGQIVQVMYNGTAFEITSPISIATFTNGVTNRAGQAASGTQTIAHGLGVVPRKVKITAFYGQGFIGAGSVNSAKSVGVYNGSTTSTVFEVCQTTGSAGAVGQLAGSDTSNIIALNGLSGSAIIAGQQATIAVDATNITLTWTRNNSLMPTNADIDMMWEAEA